MGAKPRYLAHECERDSPGLVAPGQGGEDGRLRMRENLPRLRDVVGKGATDGDGVCLVNPDGVSALRSMEVLAAVHKCMETGFH